MEIIKVENFSFQYPERDEWILQDVNFTLEAGEFVLLMGLSASGKTTLLRQCKQSLAAFGERKGRILFQGKDVHELDLREDASGIGFVQQDPENQVVTDKVWHELAFGLESLGMDQATMRLRVGEIASFFAMENWFHKKVTDLSGGQLQKVNLASILAMQPELLLLDEPTAMLDPIAAVEFFQGLKRVTQEMGITVLLSEHRLTEPYPLADRVLFLEQGRITFDGTPEEFSEEMKIFPREIIESLPPPVQIFTKSNWEGQVPMTVGEALRMKPDLSEVEQSEEDLYTESPTVLSLENVFFRYEKESEDILKGIDLTLQEGEIHSILGGNGAGKTTLLKVIAGVEQPSRGTIKDHGIPRKKGKISNHIALVPQHPKALFVYKEALQELEEMTDDEDAIKEMIRKFELEKIIHSHPFDLSGGEMQRLALGKVLLKQPSILLLDEPTKGMDGKFKKKFQEILQEYVGESRSVLMVSHDTEFCAEVSHSCSLFFHGERISHGETKQFFSGNHFYTTAANKIFRSDQARIITIDDAVTAINRRERKER